MIDNIHTVKPLADILVLGDFNIDILKPHSSWDSTITLLGLTQLVKSLTRITQTSATFTDHIYTKQPRRNHRGQCTWPEHKWPLSHFLFKIPKCEPKTLSYTSFRSFKHFNKAAFFSDIHWAPFTEVLNCTDPDKALATWYNVYLTVCIVNLLFLLRKQAAWPNLVAFASQKYAYCHI